MRPAPERLGHNGDGVEGVLVVAGPASEVGSVFDAHQGTVWVVATGPLGLAHSALDLFRRHQAGGALDQRHGCAAQSGVATAFVPVDVGGFVANDFIARNGVRSKSDGV